MARARRTVKKNCFGQAHRRGMGIPVTGPLSGLGCVLQTKCVGAIWSWGSGGERSWLGVESMGLWQPLILSTDLVVSVASIGRWCLSSSTSRVYTEIAAIHTG